MPSAPFTPRMFHVEHEIIRSLRPDREIEPDCRVRFIQAGGSLFPGSPGTVKNVFRFPLTPNAEYAEVLWDDLHEVTECPLRSLCFIVEDENA